MALAWLRRLLYPADSVAVPCPRCGADVTAQAHDGDVEQHGGCPNGCTLTADEDRAVIEAASAEIERDRLW